MSSRSLCFSVDDGIRDSVDFSSVPSIMRVYYYKNGVVRTYQRVEDTVFLKGRQPKNNEWADVFAEYGLANPTPQRGSMASPSRTHCQRVAEAGDARC